MSEDTKWLNQPYEQMTNDVLRAAMAWWSKAVEDAGGWSSAYNAAKQCRYIEKEGKKRGLQIVNNHKIMVG